MSMTTTVLKAEQYSVVNIKWKWDTDGDEELFDSLPEEIVLPLQFASAAEGEDYLDDISEWISDKYGYLHNGFSVRKEYIAYVVFSEMQKQWINELLQMNDAEVYQKYDLERKKALSFTISFDDNMKAQMRFDSDFSEIILFDKDLEVCRGKCQKGTWKANYNDVVYVVEDNNMTAKKAKNIMDIAVFEKATSVMYPWKMQPKDIEKYIPYILRYLPEGYDTDTLFDVFSKVDDEIDIPAYLNNTVSLNTIRIRYSTVNCENKVRKWNQLLEEILKKWWAEDGLDLPSADDPVVECYIDENKHKVNTFKELITELNILYWSNKSNCNQKDIDSDFDVQVKRKLSLKEYLMMQFNYCNAIAIDILEHNKSKKIQEYVKQFAQIESPVADGTDVDWIRINWGDIYIFLYDNGSIRYQLDPHNGYGNELIDTFERGRFTAEILTLEEAPVARNGVLYYEEETGYPDDVPMYLPMR